MEFKENEFGDKFSCIGNGIAYTKKEEREAAAIRLMQDSENKDYAIKHFEVRTGRFFPTESCIEFELNLDTAFLSSTEITRGAEFVLLNPRQSRRSILPLL